MALPRRSLIGAAVIAAMAAGVFFGRQALVAEVRDLLGHYREQRRAAQRTSEPPFSRPAASQLGYGPGMEKTFTSPRPFGSFRVLREDGSAALSGQGPGRAVDSTRLGSIDRVWIGDFSALTAPGRYHLELDSGLASFPFDVGPGVFDRAIRAVQRAFYYQRAFTAIEAPYAEGPWVHGSDARLAPPGVEKGWHDAGDFSLYNASATTALFYLLEAYLDFAPAADDTHIPESGNGVPDLLDEARWELSWLLSVQDASGGFASTTCQDAYGPYGTNAPEHMPPYRQGEVGTIATGRAVATLARASYVLGAIDPAFASRCLEAARRGHGYLAAHPRESSDGPTCPAMRQDGDARTGREVRSYAAAGLLLATGEPRYARDFEALAVEVDNDPSFLRSNVFAALTYLRAAAGDPDRKAALVATLDRQAEAVVRDGAADPFGWARRTFWGSVAAGFHRSLFTIRQCRADPQSAHAACEQSMANLHAALGRNYLLTSFVGGIDGVTRGRQHAFHQWLAALGARPFLFPGLVAGGPIDDPATDDRSYPHQRPIAVWGYFGDPANPRDDHTAPEGRYADNDSWTTNELDVDWQAVSLYSLYFARWYAGNPP